MKRFVGATAVLGLAAIVFGYASMGKVVQETYKFPASSAAALAKCGLCHTGKMGGKLNPYGLDLKGVTKGSKTVTAAMLRSIDAKDSDGDGKTNGAELTAGTLPGAK